MVICMRNHIEVGEFVENVASDIQHGIGMLAHCSKIRTWILIVCWGIGQLVSSRFSYGLMII